MKSDILNFIVFSYSCLCTDIQIDREEERGDGQEGRSRYTLSTEEEISHYGSYPSWLKP